jgi:hypothetical protein
MIVNNKPELVADIRANAMQVGLDKLDYEGFYTLKKLGAKNESPLGYPNQYTVIKGSVCLIGNEDFVAIYMTGISEWFKTSPVMSCKKTKQGFKIETENSFYLLEK